MKAEGLILDLISQVGGSEPITTTIADRSPYEIHGSLTSYDWFQLPSGLWVAACNGTTSVITLQTSRANLKPLDFTSEDFSVECWLYSTDFSHDNTIINMGNYNSYGWWVNAIKDGSLRLTTHQSSAHQTTLSSTGQFTANQWVYLVITRDGADCLTYIQGEECTNSAGTHIDPAPANGQSSWKCYVGGYQGSQYPIEGYFGLLKVRSYKMEPSEIRYRYYSTKWKFEL